MFYWPFCNAQTARQKRPMPSRVIKELGELDPKMLRTTAATPMAKARPLRIIESKG